MCDILCNKEKDDGSQNSCLYLLGRAKKNLKACIKRTRNDTAGGSFRKMADMFTSQFSIPSSCLDHLNTFPLKVKFKNANTKNL